MVMYPHRSFNSATAVTPWVTALSRRSSRSPSSFNSATAVTPWVTLGAGRVGVRRCCFNSATAVTPWVTRYVVAYVGEDGVASIRPRR